MRIIITIFFLTFLSAFTQSQWQLNTGVPNAYYKNIIQRNDTLYIAGLNNGIYRSVNAGINWQTMNSGLSTSQALSVYQLLLTGNNLYAATADGMYKSTNAGLNWIKKSNGIVVGGGATYAFCESVFEYNGNLFTGSYTGIYRSIDGGENWIPTNMTGSAVLAKSFTVHNGVMYAARESNNSPYGYKSTDGGLTWSVLSTIGIPSITFFSETGKLWAGTIAGAWLSTNDGTNWISRNSGLTPDPYSSSLVRVNNILITSLKFGGSGMYKTTNDGLNWTNAGEGLPFLSSIEKLYVYNGKILAATSSGLWQRNINEIITGVEKQAGNVPQQFALYQNYPNPFNPTTNILFSIPPSRGAMGVTGVTLRIYDVQGKEVADITPPLGRGKEGMLWEIEWNASDFPSGVYFYQLKAGDFSETKKMILIK